MSEKRIKITAGEVVARAKLSDGPTALKLWDALPITGNANTWGDEIYFSIPVSADVESNAKEIVDKGEIAYWPSGSAFCIFWGPTPASVASEIRPASAVNPLGMIEGDASVFARVRGGTNVVLEKA